MQNMRCLRQQLQSSFAGYKLLLIKMSLDTVGAQQLLGTCGWPRDHEFAWPFHIMHPGHGSNGCILAAMILHLIIVILISPRHRAVNIWLIHTGSLIHLLNR